jgi:hypothetical protein
VVQQAQSQAEQRRNIIDEQAATAEARHTAVSGSPTTRP